MKAKIFDVNVLDRRRAEIGISMVTKRGCRVAAVSEVMPNRVGQVF